MTRISRFAIILRMNLKTYLTKHETAVSLARRISAYSSDISSWSNGKRPVPVWAAVAIERETGGLVTRRDLRPHDWHLIWPELAKDAGHEVKEPTHHE